MGFNHKTLLKHSFNMYIITFVTPIICKISTIKCHHIVAKLTTVLCDVSRQLTTTWATVAYLEILKGRAVTSQRGAITYRGATLLCGYQAKFGA